MSDVKLSGRDPRNRPAERKQVLLAKVEIDRSTQARVRLNPQHVDALADVLGQGKEFKENIEVYFDGWKYWLGDGFHRAKAYEKAGRVRVWALVREGTHRDALVHAAGANDAHGLPRTRKDVRRAILLLLDDEEYAKLSDRAIAKIVRCSDKTVGAVKLELGKDSDTRRYTDKYGNVTEMDVTGQRRRGGALPLAFPVNAFHDLPEATRGVLKGVLGHISLLPKPQYSFVLSWLKGHLPPTPKEAGELLTTLEVEEGQVGPTDLDQGDGGDDPQQGDDMPF
jgi:hypothetical protein